MDTEAAGCEPKKEHPKNLAKAVSLQIAGTQGPRVFVPLWGKYEGLLGEFAEWLESRNVQKVLSNTKWDMHVLANSGVRLRGLLGDTVVMDYLWANGQRFHGLKECMRRYFGPKAPKEIQRLIAPYTYEDAKDYNEVFKIPKIGVKGQDLKTKWLPPLTHFLARADKRVWIHKLVDYSVKDPFFSAVLFRYLRDKLNTVPWSKTKGNYYDYYQTFELPYTEVLFEMEREGCPLDLERLEQAKVGVSSSIVETEKKLFTECVKLGIKPSYLEQFNFGSGDQVADLLFNRLGATPLKMTSKRESTDGDSLESIHGNGETVAKLILRHRDLKTQLTRYLGPWTHSVKRYNGRVHTTFKQTGTATMRLSSSAVNLQNVPKPDEDDEFKLRELFVSDDPEYSVWDIDLSQAEVRVTADVTRDEALIDMLRNGYDQHLLTSTKIFPEVAAIVKGRPCTKEMCEIVAKVQGKERYDNLRRAAKIVGFGTVYGMGPSGYASKVGCSVEQGRRDLDRFFAGYPGMKMGIERVKKECYRRGYVRTFIGRYAMIPEIRSENYAIKGHAERQAFNYVIQGTVADLLKMSMILIHRDQKLRKWGVKMILQIHDELLFLGPKNRYAEAKPIIEDYVAHPYRYFGMRDLVVDTPADMGEGENWAQAKG